jgi:release factor glutamine methyltransferase
VSHGAAGPERAVTVGELLRAARAMLDTDDARIDSELLLAHVLGRARGYLFAHPEAPVAPAQCAAYRALIARRRDGEPLAYLVGRQAFWSLELALDDSTLVPRPETELLVELALEYLGAAPARVLDLGTGSGAIALALASERPQWQLLGIDRDARALAVAAANAARLGLANARFAPGDWFAGLAGERFDLVVSNPPYIRDDDPCLQDAGLRHEPRHALASGADGLDALRCIVAAAPAHLAADAWLMCEHGAEQGEAVRALFRAAGLREIATRRDLAGRERVTLGRNAGAAADER